MKRFHEFFDRWILTVWPGIFILALNLGCTFGNVLRGASDWSILINAFGVAFAIRIIVTAYMFRKEHKALKIEIREMQRKFNETMERHKSHLDESNSDKT